MRRTPSTINRAARKAPRSLEQRKRELIDALHMEGLLKSTSMMPYKRRRESGEETRPKTIDELLGSCSVCGWCDLEELDVNECVCANNLTLKLIQRAFSKEAM